jgi:hypothetical protein
VKEKLMDEKLKTTIADTANRLRMIQVDFADEPELTRNDYLSEAVEYALSDVLPDQRNEFLEHLQKRFPSVSIDSNTNGQCQSSFDESVLDDPIFLVKQLQRVAGQFPEDKKEKLAKMLSDAGLAAGDVQEQSNATTGSMAGNGIMIDGASPERAAELFEMLVDFVSKVEPFVSNTWNNLSSRSATRGRVPIKDRLTGFLNNADGQSKETVEAELKNLHRLITAIITAISKAGDHFAREHLARFSPGEIESLVRVEKKGIFVSHEVRCWQKYCELAETVTQATLELEIRKAMIEYAESLLNAGQWR